MNLNSQREYRNFYNEHYQYLVNWFNYKYKDKDLAKESAHECLTKAILNIDKYTEMESISVRSWILKICNNYFIDQHKKNLRTQDISNKVDLEYASGIIPQHQEDDFFRTFSENEVFSNIKLKIKSELKSSDYEFFEKYFIDNFKIDEMVNHYKKPKKKIYNKVFNIKKKLRDLLDDYKSV